MTTEPVSVYVPNPDNQDGVFFERMLAERSGIVGKPAHNEGRLVVYYEGNLHGFTNVVTLADRVELAAGRMANSYPTIARALVPERAVVEVGRFDRDRRCIAVTDEAPLARWLGLGDRVPNDQLTVTGGR